MKWAMKTMNVAFLLGLLLNSGTSFAQTAVADAPPAPVPSPSSSSTPSPKSAISEFKNFRDPFKIPDPEKPTGDELSELQLLPLERLTLVGILKGIGPIRAMLADDGGKTYAVKEETKVGNRHGVVKKITKDSVRILEKIENPVGDMDESWVVIKLGQKAMVESL